MEPREYLEARYGLTGALLGLEGRAYARRVELWAELAAHPTRSAAQQLAHVAVLALSAWQTSLMGRADKFRAEGDIATERDLQTRLTQLSGWIASASVDAGLVTASTGLGSPPPEIQPWGIADG